MNECFELTVVTKRNIQSVSARELHEKLGSTERFSKWWERYVSYGFEENIDFVVCTKKYAANQYGGEKKIEDYAVSIEMAKQICMLQKNEKGMEYRRYLLEVEKRFKEKMSEEYKKARQRSIEVRNNFTDTLKAHGYSKQYEYINTTKSMKKPFAITAKKPDMTEQEIKKITAAEYLAEAMIDDEFGFGQVNPVCIQASEIVCNAIQNKARRLVQ